MDLVQFPMGMTYVTMANSVSIVMHNAATNQRNNQIVANATTNITCSMIIKSGSGGGGSGGSGGSSAPK